MEKEAVKYVKELKMPVSERYLRKIILAHPDYPSIVSLADAFETMGIDCAVAKKRVDELNDVELPYLLHAEPNHIKYVRTPQDLEYAKRTYTALSGILIKIDRTDNITDPVHNRQYDRERMMRFSLALMAFAFAVLAFIPIALDLSLFSALLTTTAVAGLSIVVMLKIRESGMSWERLEAFCQTGPNTDCDSVISSTGAKLFGVFSLLNLALSYFLWQLIVLAFTAVVPSLAAVSLLAIDLGAVGSIVVIAYSVFYQWKVVGKWCKLCLLLGLISLGQFSVVLALDGSRFELSVIQSTDLLAFEALFLLFTFLLAAFTIVSAIEESEMALGESEIYHKRIFNSPRVFFGQLNGEPQMTRKEYDLDIVLGNPKGEITLTAVLNLLCRPCKEAFEQLEDFINVHRNSVRVVIRLTAGSPARGGDLSPDQYLVRYWMACIKGSEAEETRAAEMLSTWYKSMNLDAFRKVYKYDGDVSIDIVNDFINENQQWIDVNPVKETPTFFFNDRKIPRAYRIKEMTSLFSLILTEIDITDKQETEELDQVEV